MRTDCNGVHVLLNRRSGIDRRQSPADLEDLQILNSLLPLIDPGKKLCVNPDGA